MIFPKISIITASFNSEKTISDTIESILNQNYNNIEYIIIDGGSSDKTISIIEKYEGLFGGRLTWISEHDEGIYDAWNKGLKLSTGEWISFVGSDDILMENAIAIYVDIINNNQDLNFISSNNLAVKENLDPIRIVGKPWSKKMRSHCTITHVGSLHHKSLFNQKGNFNTDYRIAGDYDFLLRCFDIIKPYYIPKITVKTRIDGISDRHILRVAQEVLKLKRSNKSRPAFICFIEYFSMISKYYLRSIIDRFR